MFVPPLATNHLEFVPTRPAHRPELSDWLDGLACWVDTFKPSDPPNNNLFFPPGAFSDGKESSIRA